MSFFYSWSDDSGSEDDEEELLEEDELHSGMRQKVSERLQYCISGTNVWIYSSTGSLAFAGLSRGFRKSRLAF